MSRSPSRFKRDLIPVFASATGQEEVDAAADSIARGWMGMGPKVREFEARFGERLGSHFAMTDSGSNALHLAVEALELPPGSEVVLPSFTWVACANAVALAGHRPVFADVDERTQNVTAELVERVLTPRTRAVMVVHYAGLPAEVDAIAALGLPVIEDAAHAVDSAVGGRPCGTLGAVGVFSFDAVKNLATPDGGGIASADGGLIERARALRYCGIGGPGIERAGQEGRWWERELTRPFPRALPNDVSASIGLVQLERLAESQARRRLLFETYQRELAGLTWLERPLGPGPGVRHSYFTYLVRARDGRRDELARHLMDNGVYTTLRYQPLHLLSAFGSDAELPGCEALAEEALNLPLHPRLDDADLERVIELVRSF